MLWWLHSAVSIVQGVSFTHFWMRGEAAGQVTRGHFHKNAFADEKLQSSPAKTLNLETPWPRANSIKAHTPLSEAVAGWQTSLRSHLKAIPTKGLMNQSDADVLLSLLCHLHLMNRCFNHFRFAIFQSAAPTSAKHYTCANKHIVNNQNFMPRLYAKR